MKKNGFTLIELLAVVVILAIIAIIVIPIVSQIKSDSRESSLLTSAKIYLKEVEKQVLYSDLKKTPRKCEAGRAVTIGSPSYTVYLSDLYCGDYDLDYKVNLEIEGKTPRTATIYFENGTIKEATLTYQNGFGSDTEPLINESVVTYKNNEFTIESYTVATDEL